MPLRQRAIDRALTDRYDVVVREVGLLVEATFAVIAETGTVEPRVEQILQAAGLSRQAFYRHFRSKDELMVVVLDEGGRIMARYLEGRMARSDDPLLQIQEWIAGFMRQAQHPVGAERSRPFAVMAGRIASEVPEEYEQVQGVLRSMLLEPLRRAVAAGAATSVDLERDARAIHELVTATMNWHLVHRIAPSAPDVAALIDFVLRAIGATPPARPAPTRARARRSRA